MKVRFRIPIPVRHDDDDCVISVSRRSTIQREAAGERKGQGVDGRRTRGCSELSGVWLHKIRRLIAQQERGVCLLLRQGNTSFKPYSFT